MQTREFNRIAVRIRRRQHLDIWGQLREKLNRTAERATGDQLLLIIRFAENIVTRRA